MAKKKLEKWREVEKTPGKAGQTTVTKTSGPLKSWKEVKKDPKTGNQKTVTQRAPGSNPRKNYPPLQITGPKAKNKKK